MIKKRHNKSRMICNVTFLIPRTELPDCILTETIHIVGEFNDWNQTRTPMKPNSKGDFQVALELKPGNSYQYRYLINGNHWYNDRHADAYQPNHLGEENCVVIIPPVVG